MIKFHPHRIGNLGNALLSSMLVAGLVAGAATVAYQNFSNTYISSRVARIKSKQAVVEAQVRRRALQPEAYVDCNSISAGSCRLNDDYFVGLGNNNVAGARCDTTQTPCGIVMRNATFTASTRKFSAEVAYAGKEVTVKPVDVSLEIPLEVLQSPRFNCGEKDKTKPIFVGFRPDNGAPICEGFNECPAGQYVHEIDVTNRTVVCRELPRSIACEEQTMFTQLGWSGGPVAYQCSPLPDPPFTSHLQTRVIASSRETVTKSSTETRTLTSTSTVTTTCLDCGVNPVPQQGPPASPTNSPPSSVPQPPTTAQNQCNYEGTLYPIGSIWTDGNGEGWCEWECTSNAQTATRRCGTNLGGNEGGG